MYEKCVYVSSLDGVIWYFLRNTFWTAKWLRVLITNRNEVDLGGVLESIRIRLEFLIKPKPTWCDLNYNKFYSGFAIFTML